MKHDDELTDEQKKKNRMALDDAKAAFLQPKPAGFFGHDLLDGHGPIIGTGRLTGNATSVKNGLGCHPATRHDDVYGKDVNGVGFDLFGESFGCDGVQEEDFDGDHVKSWRERVLNGLSGWKTVFSGDGFAPNQNTMEWKNGTWVPVNWNDWDVPGAVYDENGEVVSYNDNWWEYEHGGGWIEEEERIRESELEYLAWRDEGDAELDRLRIHHYDDNDYFEAERKWEASTRKDGFKKLNFREINDGLKAQGFVNNPLYTKGDHAQPQMVPKGALVGMGGVKRCNPHRGKCECHIPTLKEMRKRMKNWNVTVFSNGKKMYWPKPGKSMEDLYTANMVKYDGTVYTGPTTTLAILTNADRRNSCRAQANWGKKVVKNQQPLVMHVAKKQVTSWGAALKKRKTKETTTTTTTTENAEPEQQVPQQQRRQSIVW